MTLLTDDEINAIADTCVGAIGGVTVWPHEFARAVERRVREKMGQWLRDNYQDFETIADLCDAMAAAPEGAGEKR